LEAALTLFAERVFAGTSLRDVSDLSKVSVGLIQYHFRSKSALYDAVRARALAAYTHAQEPQFAVPLSDFEAFLDRGLREYFRFCEGNTAWVRLAAWAALEGDDRAWPGEHDLMDRLVERVRASQAAGHIRSDLDPELLLIVVGGMMRSWLAYRDRYASRLEHLGTKLAQEDAYLSLCRDLLRHASTRGCGVRPTRRRS
jgi:AcrR family transcriptional regulator